MREYISIIKDGFEVANRNWQLVLVQLAFLFVGFFSMLVIVGIPLAIAFIVFGLDLTEMLRQPDLLGVFSIASNMISKSLPVVLFVSLSFVLYAAFLVATSIFVCSGTIGVLARTVQNGQLFSFSFFWQEAKRLFFPVFVYANIAGLGFTLFTMLMGILSESVSQIIIVAEGQEAALAEFMKVFLGMIVGLAGILIFSFLLGITLYGFAYLAFQRPRPFRALKQVVLFSYRNIRSMVLLCVLLVMFMVSLILVTVVSYFSASLPVIGNFLSMPFNILSQAALWYTIIIILAAIFTYYYRAGYLPSLPMSRQDQDSVQSRDERQEELPLQKADSQRA